MTLDKIVVRLLGVEFDIYRCIVQFRPNFDEVPITVTQRDQYHWEMLAKDVVAEPGGSENKSAAHVAVHMQRIYGVIVPFR